MDNIEELGINNGVSLNNSTVSIESSLSQPSSLSQSIGYQFYLDIKHIKHSFFIIQFLN
jgi:hypothetical protein